MTIITASLAVYGAALGTYNFFLKRGENTVKLRVTVNVGSMATGRQVPNPHISLEAVNGGLRSVNLNQRFFLLDEKTKLTPDGFGGWESIPDFPCRLEPGDKIITWKDMRLVADGMGKNGYKGKVKLVGAYGDTVGNLYKSKPRVLDLNLWTTQK